MGILIVIIIGIASAVYINYVINKPRDDSDPANPKSSPTDEPKSEDQPKS